MVVVLKEQYNQTQLNNLVEWLKSMNIEIHCCEGVKHTILGLIGDTCCVDIDLIKALDIVEEVKRIQEPYKNANRKFHPLDSEIVVDKAQGISVGNGSFQLIAGPCSVESEEQICAVAESVKKAGATMLRGGAFKPRTSPYAFQGLRGE